MAEGHPDGDGKLTVDVWDQSSGGALGLKVDFGVIRTQVVVEGENAADIGQGGNKNINV